MRTIGILGGGQLGRMLALAGYPLGLRFRFLDPSPQACAGDVGELIVGDYSDPHVLARFVAGLDCVTYEFENVPLDAASTLATFCPVYPPPAALATAQSRLIEKQFFSRLNIPVVPFVPIDDTSDLDLALHELGLPMLFKLRRYGYDGKGQVVIRTADELPHAWAELNSEPVLAERLIPFERELSLIAVRSLRGTIVYYPLIENLHQGGILRRSLVPAVPPHHALQLEAETYARRVLDALDYVGVLVLEFFQLHGHLVVNEMAPRVHNSGHWTIEGAETSQFENHLRAILGLPLGATTLRGHVAMLNLIGSVPDLAAVLKFAGTHLHSYNKAARAGRKVGHITMRADDPATLQQLLADVAQVVG